MSEYKGVPKLKQLPQCRVGYTGKNMSGGRKAVFSQSKEYQRGCRYGNVWASGVTKVAREWGT